MGEIIAFRPRARTLAPTSPRPAGEARILLFLGVRYVRWDDAATGAGPSGAKGGGKRRRKA